MAVTLPEFYAWNAGYELRKELLTRVGKVDPTHAPLWVGRVSNKQTNYDVQVKIVGGPRWGETIVFPPDTDPDTAWAQVLLWL